MKSLLVGTVIIVTGLPDKGAVLLLDDRTLSHFTSFYDW